MLMKRVGHVIRPVAKAERCIACRAAHTAPNGTLLVLMTSSLPEKSLESLTNKSAKTGPGMRCKDLMVVARGIMKAAMKNKMNPG